MLKKSAPVLLLGGLLIALPAVAQDAGKGGSKGGTSVVPTVAGSGTVSPESLIQRYTKLAGSTANATSLVNGLRTGQLVTLTDPAPPSSSGGSGGSGGELPPPSGGSGGGEMPPPMSRTSELPPPPPPPPAPVTFTPPTGSMGWGNVDIALALTEAKFTHLNISPNAQLLQSALMDTSNGILTMRANGMGWPNIAKALGFVLK